MYVGGDKIMLRSRPQSQAATRPTARMRHLPPALCASLAVAGLTCWPTLAAAQEEGDTLQEIVVTAQKREQNQQDVGVSITALTSADLRSLGITDSLQLGAMAPSVQLNSASGGNYGSQLTIRGVSQSDFSPHQESPNSIYIDDVYVSAPNAAGAQMFDVDRVEVLRGPQGTLFGRNSTGGLVSFVTNKPTADTEGYADLTYGEFHEVRAEAAAGGTLADGIRGRLALASQDNNGYDENYYPGQSELNSTHFKGLRGALEFDVTDKLQARFSVSYLHDSDVEGFYGHLNTYFDPANSGRPAPLPANLDVYGTGPGNDALGYRSPYTGPEGAISHAGFLHRDILSPTVHVSWDLGAATLTSVSNFTHMSFDYDESCSGAPQTTCEDPYVQHLKQWSEELRLNGSSGSLTWVTGLYVLNVTQHDRGDFSEPYFAQTDDAYSAYNTFEQKLTTGSVFGQAEYLFSPHWRATLGVRVTHDDKEFSSQSYQASLGSFVPGGGYTDYNPPLLIADFSKATVGGAAEEINTYPTGKAQLDYIFSNDALLYASVSRGAKGAGFNSNTTGATPNELIPFKGEHMIAYELGEKLTLLNDRMTVNSGIFYYDYTNYQAFQYRDGPNPFVSNVNGRFMGGEFEVVARPMHGLDVHLGIGGLSALLYNVSTVNIGIVNQQPTDTPKWTGNALVRYHWAMGGGDASVMWSGDFVTGRFNSVDNTPSVYIHGSSGQNVGAGFSQGHWDFNVRVNNVFNNVRQTGAYDETASFGYTITTFMPPRWWMATVRYHL
jgi:iron complex outermembrane recepter protein